MSTDTVEMIKQYPQEVGCSSLSFHGDDVYIGSYSRIFQWNVTTDTVATLEGYPNSLNQGLFCHIWLYIVVRLYLCSRHHL